MGAGAGEGNGESMSDAGRVSVWERSGDGQWLWVHTSVKELNSDVECPSVYVLLLLVNK